MGRGLHTADVFWNNGLHLMEIVLAHFNQRTTLTLFIYQYLQFYLFTILMDHVIQSIKISIKTIGLVPIINKINVWELSKFAQRSNIQQFSDGLAQAQATVAIKISIV